MKHFISVLIFLISVSAYSQGIDFYKGDFAGAKEKAKQENKIIFIDAYTTWCGPCKYLVKTIFTQKEVGDFYNANFISFRLDMEKGEGIEFRRKYNVRAFPTLLFVDSLGNLMHQGVGAMKAENLIELGKVAMNPEKRLKELKERYKNGERSTQFIQQYLNVAYNAYLDVKECVDWYFYTQSDEELMTKDNIELIADLVKDPDHRCFKFIINNQEKCQKMTDKKLNSYIENVFSRNIYLAQRKGKDDYEKAVLKMKNSGYKGADKLIAKNELNKLRYAKKRDWKKITEKANEYFEKYAQDDSDMRNELAWSYYENEDVQDKKLLKNALKWAKESVELDERYMNTDTYAALLYKLKKKKEAAKVARKAIELAKKSGEDASETEKLLEKINKL
jgi:thioredoxin-related protein